MYINLIVPRKYKYQVGLKFNVDISRKFFNICVVTVVNI